MRPSSDEYAEFYAGYVAKVPETEIMPVLKEQLSDVVLFWRSIPESAATIVHPPYQWNVRQVLDHLLDGERIFGHRLHRIGRGDQTPLPGFDENAYSLASEEHPAPLADIIEMFEQTRRVNILFLKNLAPSAWQRTGTASNCRISVRALAWILAGHVRHHDEILRKRLGM
ncbi:MAG: DinB family protein [Planctomycetaceae bacterium]|nr:DinB family protein [Planctomycetaceae bacterium]